jgi:NADH-quinone oxidoreductase subunit F
MFVIFMPIDLTFADEVVARTGRKPEAVIPILQRLQEHYGYLPEEALRRVCERSEITPAAIAGVASFYDMFRLQPTGKHLVRVCRGTACHVAGVGRVEDALRRHLAVPDGQDTDPTGQVTIEPVACLGVCTLAPVLKFGEHTFGHTSAEGMPKLLREFEELQTEAKTTLSTEEIRTRATKPNAVEISVGLGSCCMAKGSAKLFHALQGFAGETAGKVAVKRVGCVGMCHRTPMVEVTQPGRPGMYYSDLSPGLAAALVQRYVAPRGIGSRVGRVWTRLLDGLMLDDAKEHREVQQHAVSPRDAELRAFFDKQVRIATEHFGKIDPLDLDEYLAMGGFEALRKFQQPEIASRVPEPTPGPSQEGNDSAGAFGLAPLRGGAGGGSVHGQGDRQNQSEIRNPKCEIGPGLLTSAATSDEIISSIEQSGLRGRGGAGFPSGQKWRMVAAQKNATKYVICNGDEGDPGAFMDRMILESFPFRVIEGLMLAALAVGAQEGIFYIRHEYPLAVTRVRAAIAELERRGYIRASANVPEQESKAVQNFDPPGSKFCNRSGLLRLSVFEGAGAFVCGEETALIASIEGQRGMPKLRPPFPAQEGLWGKPTLINNVETLAMVPWILRHGAEKFAAIGTAKSKGTKVFALAGKVERGGLIEVPMGLTLREIVENIGGGVGVGRRFKAVQIGGPSGGCVPARLADTPVDFESLREIGAIMGSGGLVVLDDTSCMVDIARYFLQFTQEQSCGKCTFCRIGTKRMREILERLCAGKATRQHLEELERLAVQVGAGSLCGLGKTAPNPVLTTIRYFRDEYEAHLQGRCPAGKCAALIKYSINTDCTGCTICAQHCPVDAIPMTPHAQHVIDDAKCTRCDTCRVVCPEHAVEVK